MNISQDYSKIESCYSETYPEMRKMDFFVPKEIKATYTLLFIHGGGWENGNKDQWSKVAAYFASQGYPAASIGYRLMPNDIYPTQVEDARLAMQRIKKWNQELGLDPNKVVAIGSSAGGYLAAMLATIHPDEEIGVTDELVGRETIPYAVVGYCPVVTLELDRSFVRTFMGGPIELNAAGYREASPKYRIRGKEPKFLLIQGDKDDTTPLKDTQDFHERIIQAGGSSELVVLPGVGHGFGYGVESDSQKLAIQAMGNFLKALEDID